MIRFEVTFDPGDLLGKLKSARTAALEELSDELVKGFQRWTATWEHAAPIVKEVGDHEAVVGVDDLIAFFLNFGTSIRFYGSLDGRYITKTIPGVLDSRPGGGPMIFWGGQEFPGIDARRADEVNAEEVQAKAVGIVAAAYAAALA